MKQKRSASMSRRPSTAGLGPDHHHAERPCAPRGNEERRGVGLFRGLHPASTATVVQVKDGESLMTAAPSPKARSTSAGSPSSRPPIWTPRSIGGASWRASSRRYRSRCGPSRTTRRIERQPGTRTGGHRASVSRGVQAVPSLSWSVDSETSTSPRKRSRMRSRSRCSDGRPPGCRPARRDGSSRQRGIASSIASAARRRVTTGTHRPH